MKAAYIQIRPINTWHKGSKHVINGSGMKEPPDPISNMAHIPRQLTANINRVNTKRTLIPTYIQTVDGSGTSPCRVRHKEGSTENAYPLLTASFWIGSRMTDHLHR